MGYNTMVQGEGTIISEVYSGKDQVGEWFVNFIVRTRDRNIIRVHLWDTEARQLRRKLDTQSVKGIEIGFRGRLRGTYDEKPTVVADLDGILPPGIEKDRG